MNMKVIGIVSAAVLGVAAASAFAGPTSYDFYTLGGSPAAPGMDYGATSATWGNLTATSEVTNNGGSTWGTDGALDLFIKNGNSATEQGLGLAGSSYDHNEIEYPGGIQLALSGNGHFTGVSMGSIQSGEEWEVLGLSGNTWTTLGYGMGASNPTENFSISGNYSTILVFDPDQSASSVSDSNDIVLMSATTVPEPGTLALLGLGLAGVALVASRRRKARSDA